MKTIGVEEDEIVVGLRGVIVDGRLRGVMCEVIGVGRAADEVQVIEVRRESDGAPIQFPRIVVPESPMGQIVLFGRDGSYLQFGDLAAGFIRLGLLRFDEAAR